jgi:Ca2+-binding RTX toxin-like protein
MLVIGGTTGNDAIHITKVGNTDSLEVTVNGVSQGVFAPTGRIVAHGQAGDDTIRWWAAWNIRRGSTATRATTLKGGKGDDVLFGGADNDELQGAGAAICSSAESRGLLKGNQGDDLLIAGFTDFDDDPPTMCSIHHEWIRTDRSYEERVAARPVLVAGVTVHDDGDADTLTGNQGQDWFFANSRRAHWT